MQSPYASVPYQKPLDKAMDICYTRQKIEYNGIG